MKVQEFYDVTTNTLTYVIYDPNTKNAVIIDPVMDYEPHSSTISKNSALRVLRFVQEMELHVHYIMETHVHADHFTSAHFLRQALPQAKTGIHESIRTVQNTFKKVFNFHEGFDTNGSAFDLLFKDEQELNAGSLRIKVLHTPGHTPACVSYLINNEAVFTGDTLFMPDFGTGRCDFPGGSAKDLYDSIHEKLYKLPDHIKVYVGHDYPPEGRELEFQTTIGEQKLANVHIRQETTQNEFINFRIERDKQLKAPKLLLASIQFNAQNGQPPQPEDNGLSYLKIPLQTA